jgi:hypothetical protein
MLAPVLSFYAKKTPGVPVIGPGEVNYVLIGVNAHIRFR